MRSYLRHVCRRIWHGYNQKLLFASIILVAGCVLGYLFEQGKPLIPIKNPGHDWLYYFSHNTKQAASFIFLGVVSYGVLSLIFLFINGLIIGMGMEIVVQHHRVDLLWTALLPHAVFEIAGLLWASVLPFIIWKWVIVWIRDKRMPTALLRYELVPSILAIVMLFLIAAMLESTFGM